jgi:geranylgeranyl diphosphate synthase type I
MKAKDYLANYTRAAEKFLDKFFLEKKREAAKISPFCQEMIGIYREYMRGGKMARGALVYLGYQCMGGKNKKIALPASAAIEIFHSFLLMHDDWIDGDLVRRGKPTIHVQYEKIFRQKKWQGKAFHWGESMAVMLGDIGCFLAFEILANLEENPERKAEAIAHLCDCLLKTAYGESLDITYDYFKGISYRDTLAVRKLKTAYYSLVMPLSTGAILGGAGKGVVEAIKSYGLPVGIAFQLRDDELGLFGEEESLGKPTLTDLLEGKKTMLILKAIEKLKGKDKKQLLFVWGNEKAKLAEITRAKRLILKSGALKFSQKKARELAEKGKKYIPQITSNREVQDTLRSLADFMIERGK